MADEERVWRQRHSHETSTVGSGTTGTATYLVDAQRWTFLSKDCNVQEIFPENLNQREFTLQLFEEAEVVVPSRIVPSVDTQELGKDTSYEGVVPSSILREVVTEPPTSASSIQGCRIAFGSATRLDIDGLDSGNLFQPVTAYVSGQNAGQLCVTCIGRRTIRYTAQDHNSVELIVPQIRDDHGTIWKHDEHIQQLVFSSPTSTSIGDRFLAARSQSATRIFEPLLGRPMSSTKQPGTIELSLVLSLPAAATGGSAHADIAFDPQNHKRFAIVDIEGNWSVWTIHGKRAYNARVAYKARLKGSGKIFSWSTRQRPEGMDLYFDNWHRVLWLPSGKEKLDRLLVCNRQDAKIFDIQGECIYSVDVRLNTHKMNAKILDLKHGPGTSTFFVLTLNQILCFDAAKQDWKVPGHPALLCAWQHSYNPQDSSLQMAVLNKADHGLVLLYSKRFNWFTRYELRISEDDNEQYVVASIPENISWPDEIAHEDVSTVVLATSEVKDRGELLNMAQVIVQYDDLSVRVLDAALDTSWKKHHAEDEYVLRLPGARGSSTKSSTYVDNSDPENELIGFIVDDADEDSQQATEVVIGTELQAKKVISSNGKQNLSHVLATLQTSQDAQSARTDPGIAAILANLEHEMETADLASVFGRSLTLASLLDDVRVEDIEVDSTRIEEVIGRIANRSNDLVMESCTNHEPSALLTIYEQQFENHVTPLVHDIPDRFKVQRERVIREIALDQKLASHKLGPAIAIAPALDESLPKEFPVEGDVFSDPAVPTEQSKVESRPMSATQPADGEYQVLAGKVKIAQDRDLGLALSRLSRYSTIVLKQEVAMDEDVSSQIHQMLGHLPEDIELSPSDYDWRQSELAAAVDKAVGLPSLTDQRQRKPSRRGLPRALAKTETMLPSTDLPLRMASGNVINSQWNENVRGRAHAETQPAMIFSDGIQQDRGQSQLETGLSAFASTQPVRGSYGDRQEPVKDRVRKKRRVAGF